MSALLFAVLALAIVLAAIILDRRGRVPRRVAAAGGIGARLVMVATLATLVLVPASAFAQDVMTAPPSSPETWSSWLLSGCATVVTFAVTWGAKQWIGIQLDRQAQDSIHRAVETGAKAVVANLGLGARLDDAVADVTSYVERSVPDAIKRLKPPADVLQQLVMSKLPPSLLPRVSGL